MQQYERTITMKTSILAKLLIVIMTLGIIPLIVLGIFSFWNVSSMENTAVGKLDEMTSTAVENSSNDLNCPRYGNNETHGR